MLDLLLVVCQIVAFISGIIVIRNLKTTFDMATQREIGGCPNCQNDGLIELLLLICQMAGFISYILIVAAVPKHVYLSPRSAFVDNDISRINVARGMFD